MTSCALPLIKDRTQELKIYEGSYTDTSGNKLFIGQENNHLYYIWNGLDQRNFFPLYFDESDEFSSMVLNILFIRNEKNEIIKAYCRPGGKKTLATKNL